METRDVRGTPIAAFWAAFAAVIKEKTKVSVGSGRLSLMIGIGTVTRLTPAGIVTVP